MPSPPALAARRGTAFHAWVEQHFARAAFVDVLDLPGSADDDPADDEELPLMKERFLASEWAHRSPEAIEIAIETTVAEMAIRGRIDAVFPRPGWRVHRRGLEDRRQTFRARRPGCVPCSWGPTVWPLPGFGDSPWTRSMRRSTTPARVRRCIPELPDEEQLAALDGVDPGLAVRGYPSGRRRPSVHSRATRRSSDEAFRPGLFRVICRLGGVNIP